jgi:dTMP kinase
MSCQFITFEGVEGAGKTTQIGLTETWLRSLGHRVKVTREPGGTALGREIRQVLLQGHESSNLAELLLFMADRAHHIETLILPHLHSREIVLCDRFFDSTIAYQHFGRGIELDLICQLNHIATKGLQPDLTFWLDVAIEQGKSVSVNPDRFESLDLGFHERVYHGFSQLAKQESNRIVRIDGNGSIDQIQFQIQDVLANKLTTA